MSLLDGTNSAVCRESICVDHASIPPLRLNTFVKPLPCKNSATRRLRPPEWHITTSGLSGIELREPRRNLAHRDVQGAVDGRDRELVVLAHVEQHDVAAARRSLASARRTQWGLAPECPA